eukprot:CAMPEP_0168201812 /NCGR_PEP_ID=MMETSP0139_2-20121125/23927_1 /TAXON_ID=44445 /ORGANISM="Pseudo-nitzschia australis, Strain 10249 10 AB" /LENGTH=193 /DNA_ID=CAMNT_0008127435 /DNA_START=183 /DNA_END=765 /DNA_ORIENTATION=+
MFTPQDLRYPFRIAIDDSTIVVILVVYIFVVECGHGRNGYDDVSSTRQSSSIAFVDSHCCPGAVGIGPNRSGYRPGNKNNRGDDGKDNDPLPWIKLPRLDFVEVAGQKDLPPPVAAAATIDRKEQQRVYEELENLRLRLNRELENVRKRRQDATGATAIGGQDDVDDDMAEAKRLQNSLEGLMKLYGLEYETE